MIFFVVIFGVEAEDVVDGADDGAGFAFVEFAFGVERLFEGSAGAGAGVLVFLEEHGFAAGAGEGIDEAHEGGGRLGQVAERRIRRGRSLGAECLVVGVDTSEKLLEFSRV